MRRRALAAAACASVLLGACSSVSPSTATYDWTTSSSFAQGAADLLYDYSNVHDAIDHHASTASVRTYCAELFADANGENTDLLPTPDTQLTTLLSDAVDGFVHAAYQCTRNAGDASVQRTILGECRGAIGSLVAAVLRDQAVTGRALVVQGIS
ncbi:MAG TPA: hypothetical protein VMQ40_01650 [Acidimicrobiales bacterium]|jgi:hypothetical protein|nr:hypothetical protein [Acidimicrobiales bacterium]